MFDCSCNSRPWGNIVCILLHFRYLLVAILDVIDKEWNNLLYYCFIGFLILKNLWFDTIFIFLGNIVMD